MVKLGLMLSRSGGWFWTLKSWELIFKEPMLEKTGLFCQHVGKIIRTPDQWNGWHLPAWRRLALLAPCFARPSWWTKISRSKEDCRGRDMVDSYFDPGGDLCGVSWDGHGWGLIGMVFLQGKNFFWASVCKLSSSWPLSVIPVGAFVSGNWENALRCNQANPWWFHFMTPVALKVWLISWALSVRTGCKHGVYYNDITNVN